MSSTTTHLVTGGNRGIGLGLVKALLSRDNSTVIASIRNHIPSGSQVLSSLPAGKNSKLIIVVIEATSKESIIAAVDELRSIHGITTLDVVVANAGISTVWPFVKNVTSEDMEAHYKVNVVGPVLLFQAVLPLLENAKIPKFVTISSTAGMIEDMEKVNFENAAYGPSKAALNYITKKIHLEYPSLIAFPISPGWVRTKMGNAGAVHFGAKEAAITIEESAQGLVKLIDNATREQSSGKFWSWDGEQLTW